MILWVLVRRLLALFIRLLLLNRIVTIGLLVLFFAFFVGVPLARGIAAAGSATTGRSAVSAADLAPARSVQAARGAPVADDPPAPAVEAYIKGMSTFDARPMWAAMSADALSQMQSRGGSFAKLQQGLDEMKSSGARYDEIAYVGGYPLRDGNHYFFYVMTRHGFADSNTLDQVYFIFTVGPDGKIARID